MADDVIVVVRAPPQMVVVTAPAAPVVQVMQFGMQGPQGPAGLALQYSQNDW